MIIIIIIIMIGYKSWGLLVHTIFAHLHWMYKAEPNVFLGLIEKTSLNVWHFEANTLKDNMLDRCSWLQYHFSLEIATFIKYLFVFSKYVSFWNDGSEIEAVTPGFTLQLING